MCSKKWTVFREEYTWGILWASRNIKCSLTNIRAYFRAKWRLLFIYTPPNSFARSLARSDWSKHVAWPNISHLKLGSIREISQFFKNVREQYLKDSTHNSLHLARKLATIFVRGHYLVNLLNGLYWRLYFMWFIDWQISMSARVDNTAVAVNRHAWTMMDLTAVSAGQATKLLGDPVLVSIYRWWFQNFQIYLALC